MSLGRVLVEKFQPETLEWLGARAEIVVDAGEPSLSLPPDTLITFAGLEKVVLVVDGKAQEKTVVTGRRGDNWVEIVSGLNEGQLVVVEPAGLRTGNPLTVATPASNQTAAANPGS